jgi:mRNA-degrading endonuclease toxin of MazEF toxin-antitoxin module
MRFYGEIVLVSALLDPQGRHPKDRPCVIVTPNDELGEGLPLQVVAITTYLPTPLPADHVLLPYMDPRHPKTGLNKKNAAVCSWLARIAEDRVIRSVGFTPGKQLVAIAELLERRRLAGGEPTGEEPSA